MWRLASLSEVDFHVLSRTRLQLFICWQAPLLRVAQSEITAVRNRHWYIQRQSSYLDKPTVSVFETKYHRLYLIKSLIANKQYNHTMYKALSNQKKITSRCTYLEACFKYIKKVDMTVKVLLKYHSQYAYSISKTGR